VKGDASMVLVVVVLVLGLSGRKWWMAGGGVRKQKGGRGCADKKGEGGRGEDEREREGERELVMENDIDTRLADLSH